MCKWVWLIRAEVLSRLIVSLSCLLMCLSVFFSLVVMPALFFITALIHANLFHNLSHWVSHALHVIFLFCFPVFLSFIFLMQFGWSPPHTHTEPCKRCTETILVLQIFRNALCCMNKDSLTPICMHPHIALYSVSYLSLALLCFHTPSYVTHAAYTLTFIFYSVSSPNTATTLW